jgi:hypothetical protein
MSKAAFFVRLFSKSDLTDEEIVKFMIKNYFLQGETLEDFQDELVFICNKGCEDAKKIRGRFENVLEQYCG